MFPDVVTTGVDVADDAVTALFWRLAQAEGLPVPTEAEVQAALDLARVVAHSTVRRGAPLVCYAMGLAMGTATDPAERARRLRELADRLDVAADG